MKIIENITVYQCEFCKRKMYRKHAMLAHEVKCTYNPENIAKCSGCDFIKEIETTYTVDDYDGEREVSTKAFRCTKLDKMLYPAKVVHKGILEKYPESFEGQEQMPKECEYFSFDPGF
jgi:hypothetical protein